MKTLAHHINTVRAKPPHIRKQVAYGTAFGATLVLALAWFAGNLALGTYALHAPTIATNDTSSDTTTTSATPARQSLLGAVESAFSGSSDQQAHIDVVNQGTNLPAPAPAPATQPTIIPF